MMVRTRQFFLILLVFASVPVLAQTVIRVAPEGNDNNSGANWALAKRTLYGAHAAASGPTQIWVKAGVYNEYLTVNKDGVELYGGFAGDEVFLPDRHGGDTVLDGLNAGRPLKVDRADDVVLDRLVVRNGAAYGYGGGVELYSCNNLVMRDCTVEDSTSASGNHGGGMSISNGSVTLENVTLRRCTTAGRGGGFRAVGAVLQASGLVVEDCQALIGGGAALESGDGFLVDSRFVHNRATSTATEGGGALWLRSVQRLTISRNFFCRNEAGFGSAVDATYYTTTEISNNVFSDNLAGSGTIFVRDSGTWPLFYNNTIADNHSTAGPSAVYVVSYGNAKFRNDVVAYNDGPVAAVGRDATGAYNWAYANFWQNAVAPFVDPADLSGAGPTTSQTDPRFLNRQWIEDPCGYALRPDSTVLDYAQDLVVNDFAGADRPVNSKGYAQAYPDKGAFEYQAVEQYVSLEGWLGPNGDGDQSSLRLWLEVYDLGGNLLAARWVPQSADGFYLLFGDHFPCGGGPYEVVLSAPGFLSHREYVTALPACNSTGVDVELAAGDLNGDNAVTLYDLNLVLLSFGDAEAPSEDVNGDGAVDIRDINLVLLNMGAAGD